MKPIAIIYGSTGDNTKTVAHKIAKLIPEVEVVNVATASITDLEKYSNLILGTSTWGFGDLQDDWENFLPTLKKANLEGKTIALFGLGDSSSYPDTFTDGMAILYEAIKDKECTFIGSVPTIKYSFDSSRSDIGGRFVGLALDEENEYDKTDQRIGEWVKEILPQFQ